MQRLKTHPHMRKHFEGGRRISYGARALSEGGFQSIPKLVFPGGALIGDSAGFLNLPKIKGTHCAMKSGMLAADAVADALAGRQAGGAGRPIRKSIQAKLAVHELKSERNLRPAFEKFGLYGFLAYSGLDTFILRGRAPWTLHGAPGLRHAAQRRIRAENRLSQAGWRADLRPANSSVFLSNTNHEENQPIHLKLRDPSLWLANNWERFRSPESRYCPAGVYEVVGEEQGTPRLQINAQNCVHCKTCDIKDPTAEHRLGDA
jgi:electron-transferring-flavoprotein dehydrogenase